MRNFFLTAAALLFIGNTSVFAVPVIQLYVEGASYDQLVGVQGNFGRTLGLDDDWAYQIILIVGNYADLWERHFAPLGLSRGLNATWKDVGLHSALPFR